MQTHPMDIPSQELVTKDNVTISVDAMAFYKIEDAEKALLNISDVVHAVNETAQVSLREPLSNKTFDEIIHERDQAGQAVQATLERIAANWGVTISGVKLKNIRVDPSMIRAMSRQAEAKRVREARLIEASAEAEAAKKLVEAARQFEEAPTALQLRTLQAYTQIAAEKNNTFFLPTSLLPVLHRLLLMRPKVQGIDWMGRNQPIEDISRKWPKWLSPLVSRAHYKTDI